MSTRIRLFMAATSLLLVLASPAAATGRSVERGDGRTASTPKMLALHVGTWNRQVASLIPAGFVPGTVPTSSRSAGLLAAAGFGGLGGFGSALLGSAPAGKGPSTLAVNPATHTIYVANGFNLNGPNALGNTVSVIDARDCRAQDVSRCKGPWPTITVGNQPSSVAVDQATDTVYVTNSADSTVSVFNGATCNGQVTEGCGQTPATVPVGAGPLGIFADHANHTVYVGSFDNGNGNTVSMIDSAACNASDLASCPTSPPPTVTVAGGPGDVDVNQRTHTVYVANLTGMSVFDANTCNATDHSGCGAVGEVTAPPCDLNRFPWCGPFSAKVDAANNTIYVTDGTTAVFAFDGRTCDASDLAGCASAAPGIVTPFPQPGFEADLWIAVDAAHHSVYVTYQKDDTLVVIDANVCNGSHLAACATLRPPTIHTGADPESVVLDPQTQTLYTANEVDNTVSVIDASRCNAQNTSGCRHPAPAFLSQPGAMAADPAVHTLYNTSGTNTVSMIDTRTCNVHRLTGCAQRATATVGAFPSAVAVDRRTHTVYVANRGAGTGTGTVTVIDARTCNATHAAGCANVKTLQVPAGHAHDLAVNAVTDTVYVATTTSSGPNLISVFNGATCNAKTSLGCDQTPATLAVADSGGGNSVLNLAVNKATNTIYAINIVFPPNNGPQIGESVYVINGAICDAANTTGCGQTPATVNTGHNSNPSGIAVDQATNTIYTANVWDGEYAGTVSVINGATCNGSNMTGCGQTPKTVAAGFGAAGVAIDQTTHQVYVTNIEDTSVSVINGKSCNGTDTTGCAETPPKVAVGNYPVAIAIDPASDSGYVTNLDNTVSVIPLSN